MTDLTNEMPGKAEPTFELLLGDCRHLLRNLPEGSVNCCVTSPPYYGLRDYGVEGQMGLEQTPDDFVESLVGVFREVRRVLKDDGTLWLNLGDSYGSASNKYLLGIKPKELIGIPWRVAFALQQDDWYLRQDIIWQKPNPMPESVKDRCTKSHEYIFLLSKQPKYYFDGDSIKEPSVTKDTRRPHGRGHLGGRPSSGGRGEAPTHNPELRNRRSVWTVPTKPFKGAHFATFPPKLIEPCILAGCPEGGIVLDPFTGSGTTGSVSLLSRRNFLGIELNQEYHEMATLRLKTTISELNSQGAK